jgi:RimJ/RimL family protein N-acetyltransferase
MPTLEQQATALRQKRASPDHLFLVAQVEGRLVGMASLDGSAMRRFAHGADLGLAVLRDFWGQGLGRALTESLLDWADARGLVRVSLEVDEHNVRAIRLYESLGFAHEGRLRARRRHGDTYADTCQMARVRVPGA